MKQALSWIFFIYLLVLIVIPLKVFAVESFLESNHQNLLYTGSEIIEPAYIKKESLFDCSYLGDSFQEFLKTQTESNFSLNDEELEAISFYLLANSKAHRGDWIEANQLYKKALNYKSDFFFALSSNALVEYQLGKYNKAESDMRSLIKENPMCADPRASLSALLWRKGLIGEAKSNWAAVLGLDSRYMDQDWLLNIRYWPPGPIKDLFNFLDLVKQ